MRVINNSANMVINSMRTIGLVTSCIVDLINDNQKIRRLCRYKTKTPLLPVGFILGKPVQQPDITTSLDEKSKDSSGNVIEPVLFDGMFDPEMQTNLDVGIYVYDYNTTFDNTFGKCSISVDIVIPFEYQKLQTKGDKRSDLIASEIINILCNSPVTKDKNVEWFNELGNIEFVNKKVGNGRLSQKNNSYRRTLIFETTIYNRPRLK